MNRVASIKSCQPDTSYVYFGQNTVINESDTAFVIDAVTLDRAHGIVIDGAWIVPTGRNLMGTAKTSRHLNSDPG